MTFAVQMWGSVINLHASQCHNSNVSTGCLFQPGFTHIRMPDDCLMYSIVKDSNADLTVGN